MHKMSVTKRHDEAYRPRLNPVLRDRIDTFVNKLQIENVPLSNINNILCSIGLECLERSFEHFEGQIKQSDFAQKFLKDLIK